MMINYFKEITKIPRPSNHEEKIANYLINFAKEKSLEHYIDDSKNIIIKKPATLEKENSPAIILQAHTDMVCEKNANINIDFYNDAIEIIQSEDTITANGTTLGADDGIGIAMILSILDSTEISHPALECIFTSAEEVGMIGAKGLDTSNLSAKSLINLDSEEEGYFITGCAGGGNYNITFSSTIVPIPSNLCLLEIEITGLTGGHSGTDINKGLLNANVLLANLLSECINTFDIRLVSINGGLRDNAIPRESKAIIAVPKDLQSTIQSRLQTKSELITSQNSTNEPNLTILISTCSDSYSDCYSNTDSVRIISMICNLPNGVIAMEKHLPDLVETSLSLGIVSTIDNATKLTYHIRSSSKPQFALLKDHMSSIVSADNFDSHWLITTSGEYPAWEYKEDSILTQKAVTAYKTLFQKSPIVTTIHAGLECGIIAEKIPGLDVLSIGPDITGAHSPSETLYLPSAYRTFNLLKEILSTL